MLVFRKKFIFSWVGWFCFVAVAAVEPCHLQGNDSISANGVYRVHPAFLLRFGLNGGLFSVKDESTSPLIYSGLLPGVNIGFSAKGRKMYGEATLDFFYGHLVSENYPSIDDDRATAYNSCLNAGIARQVLAFNHHSSEVYFGDNMQFMANFRKNSKFGNASLNFELFATNGPIIYFFKDIHLKNDLSAFSFLRHPFSCRHVGVSAFLFIPFVAAVLRPDYAVINDFVNSSVPEVNVRYLSYESFKRLFEMETTLHLNYYLTNRHIIRISYHWFYYNYHPGINNVMGVNDALTISYLFQLNK